jgi:hypothetical protein
MAVLPSAESETDTPWAAIPITPVPTSLLPCWVHTPLLRVKTHVAPTLPLSASPPTMAVLPSPDSATEKPCSPRSLSEYETDFAGQKSASRILLDA